MSRSGALFEKEPYFDLSTRRAQITWTLCIQNFHVQATHHCGSKANQNNKLRSSEPFKSLLVSFSFFA